MIDRVSENNLILQNRSKILGVVRCALSKIDPRLVDHGERVAYLAVKIWHERQAHDHIDPSKLFVLCLLHDIGAYKTDEIDDMVHFETEAFLDHSLYGYLFLKNTSRLSAYAEAILYHHADYASAVVQRCACAEYASIIHLADRADILLSTGKRDFRVLGALSGDTFNPGDVTALFQAEARHGIASQIVDGSYRDEFLKMAAMAEIAADEVMDYLKLLVYAIDFRSPYTVTHTADTTIISMEIGRLLGLSKHDMDALYLGAFLHDIGKIAIPHRILEKPARLTAEEFEVVKRHISEGEQILRGVVSDEICDIALRHHEKLDGSGYIYGLTAEHLTLPQRIVAVADILSALSQQRSYKAPYPKERVISILTEMKEDGKLCPLVVDTVCRNYDEILQNTELSHDPIKTVYANLVQEYASRRAVLPAVSNM